MKPHIRKTRGVWICDLWQKCSIGKGRHTIVPHRLPQPVGHGYTPREAYADWQRQQEKA